MQALKTLVCGKMIFVVALVFLATPSAHAKFKFNKIPSRTGDYCKDEIIEFLEHKYGAQVQVEQMHRLIQTTHIIAKTNLCSNWMEFHFRGDDISCQSTQYGSRTRYMTHGFGFGDCKPLVRF